MNNHQQNHTSENVEQETSVPQKDVSAPQVKNEAQNANPLPVKTEFVANASSSADKVASDYHSELMADMLKNNPDKAVEDALIQGVEAEVNSEPQPYAVLSNVEKTSDYRNLEVAGVNIASSVQSTYQSVNPYIGDKAGLAYQSLSNYDSFSDLGNAGSVDIFKGNKISSVQASSWHSSSFQEFTVPVNKVTLSAFAKEEGTFPLNLSHPDSHSNHTDGLLRLLKAGAGEIALTLSLQDITAQAQNDGQILVAEKAPILMVPPFPSLPEKPMMFDGELPDYKLQVLTDKGPVDAATLLPPSSETESDGQTLVAEKAPILIVPPLPSLPEKPMIFDGELPDYKLQVLTDKGPVDASTLLPPSSETESDGQTLVAEKAPILIVPPLPSLPEKPMMFDGDMIDYKLQFLTVEGQDKQGQESVDTATFIPINGLAGDDITASLLQYFGGGKVSNESPSNLEQAVSSPLPADHTAIGYSIYTQSSADTDNDPTSLV